MEEPVDTTTVDINGIKIPTRTYNFQGLGRWTIRGILGAEEVELQSSVEVSKEHGKIKVNAADSLYKRIRLCTVESPFGTDPSISEMKAKLMKGPTDVLVSAIDELSEVPYEIEKN